MCRTGPRTRASRRIFMSPTTGSDDDLVTPSKLTSATSGSFTSSAMDCSTTAALRAATDDELKTARWKVWIMGQKGYARIRTSLVI